MLERLSIPDVKLPAPEVRIELMEGENSPTDEETVYSKIVTINPLLEDLVSDLDLVSSKTGEKIRKAEIMYQLRIVETVSSTQLLTIAQIIIGKEDSYTKKELVTRLMYAATVSPGRALKGIRLMLDAGVIEATPEGRYCLIGSLFK